MITCCVRYVLNLDEIAAFKEYAEIWAALIPRLGGTHHGYFLPLDDADARERSSAFSFPGAGSNGPVNVALALFSFPDWKAFDAYRRDAGDQPECQAARRLVERTRCFTSYERTFMTASVD